MARSAPAPVPSSSPIALADTSVILTPPNPARLYSSLRDSGYENDAAVADLVDNSIDGDATAVRVHVEPKAGVLREEDARIVVADDGVGMDASTLAEALKLGSLAEHDPTSDLGKYGLGLITASISIARRLTVLTKTKDGELLKAVHDLDIIYKKNQFVAELQSATNSDKEIWHRYAVSEDHGTVIILQKCDQLSYSQSAALINRLKKRLGQVFRLFIAAKSRKSSQQAKFESFIALNGDPIYAIDPLMLEEFGDFLFPRTREMMPAFAELADDYKVDVPIDPTKPSKGTDQIRVRVATLPELGYAVSNELGINAPNEGIYVMRNQREIAAAQTLNIFAKAQNLNRFRAEIHIPASLDRRIGINWTKHRVVPDQALQEILKQGLGPHIASVRKVANRRRSELTTVDHRAYETLIAKKAKLLTLPKAPKIERQRDGGEKGTVSPKGTDIQREGRSEWPQRVRDRCEFREAHMTAAGPLWEPDMRGQKVIVTFNVDHPLWARFVLEESRSDEGEHAAVLELLHLFSYCLTTAEMGAFSNESEFERLINMRQQLSNNMRVLLT